MSQAPFITSILMASLSVFYVNKDACAFVDMPVPKHDWSVNVGGEVFGIVEGQDGQTAVYLVSWNRGKSWWFHVPCGAPLTALGCCSLLVALASATFAAIRAATHKK